MNSELGKMKILLLIGICVIVIMVGLLVYQNLVKKPEISPEEKISMPKTLDYNPPTTLPPEGRALGKKIAMVIAFRDFRDEEYFAPREILEKAGAQIKTASNKMGRAIGADGGEVAVDLLIENLNPIDFDAVVFVGGPGCLEALDNENSYKVARETVSQNRVIAAICISPVILAKAGVLEGKKATVWSSTMDRSPVKTLEENRAIHEGKSVVVDGEIITANGPGAAEKFAQAIIEIFK